MHVFEESDTDIDERLDAFLKREFRALGDVDIVNINDDWSFICLYNILENKYKDGTKTGQVTLAVGWFSSVPEDNLKIGSYMGFSDKALYYISVHPAYWSVDNLHEFAIQDVADINRRTLEMRRLGQKFGKKLLENLLELEKTETPTGSK